MFEGESHYLLITQYSQEITHLLWHGRDEPGAVRVSDVHPVVAGVGDVPDVHLGADVGDAAARDHPHEHLPGEVLLSAGRDTE